MGSHSHENSSTQSGFLCPDCGSTRHVTREYEEAFPYGSGSEEVQLRANITVFECTRCGTGLMGEGAQAARHAAVCRHLGLLTPSEIRVLRMNVAGTQAELSRLTGIGKASIARWESGEVLQNPANDRFLRLLQAEENIERLRIIASGKTEDVTPATQYALPKLRGLREHNPSKLLASADRFKLAYTN